MATKKKAVAKKVTKRREPLVPHADQIVVLKEDLEKLLGDWEEDGSSPPRLTRQNGTGSVKAIVDPWCGGYQNPSNPVVIGYKVSCDRYEEFGVVDVARYGSKELAMEAARAECDIHLEEYMLDIDECFRMPSEHDEPDVAACDECGEKVCSTCGRHL